MNEISEIRNQLNIIENMMKSPENIFLNLSRIQLNLSNDVRILLPNISVNDKNIKELLTAEISKMSIFNECKITSTSMFSYDVCIQSFKPKCVHCIMKINVSAGTFQIQSGCIKELNLLMNQTVHEDYEELSDIFVRFSNLTFNKRLKNAVYAFKINKDLGLKASMKDLLFALFVKKSYIDKIIKEEQRRINIVNECIKKSNKKFEETREFYRKNAPDQIKKIKEKQNQLRKYLLKTGYKEEINTADL